MDRTDYFFMWRQPGDASEWFPRSRVVTHEGVRKLEMKLETYPLDPMQDDRDRSIVAFRLAVERVRGVPEEDVMKAICARMRRAGHRVELYKQVGGGRYTRTIPVKVGRDADARFR